TRAPRRHRPRAVPGAARAPPARCARAAPFAAFRSRNAIAIARCAGYPPQQPDRPRRAGAGREARGRPCCRSASRSRTASRQPSCDNPAPTRMKAFSPPLIVARHAIAALFVAWLAACATPGPPGGGPEQRAHEAAARGDHSRAAALYMELAERAADEARDRYVLLAVEQWLEAGDGRRAAGALATVPRPAGGELLWLWAADSAALALWEGDPDRALARLQPLAQRSLPLYWRAKTEALRADAWFQKDEPARAVELYVQRENWLADEREIEWNRRRLWEGLLVSDPETLRRAGAAAPDPVVRGWLELGALATSTGRHGMAWVNGVARWQEAHIDHPGETILDELALPQDGLFQFPRRIALLLPLSGA